MNSGSQILFQWEYHDVKHRSPLWYIVALSVAIGIIIWGIFTSQYGLSFIVMLVAGIFYFIENNSDENIQVRLSTLGMEIQNNFYEYPSMQNFCIVYDGKIPVLLRIYLKKRAIPVLDIKISSEDASEIQNILSGFIEQRENSEISFSEKLIHFLKI